MYMDHQDTCTQVAPTLMRKTYLKTYLLPELHESDTISRARRAYAEQERELLWAAPTAVGQAQWDKEVLNRVGDARGSVETPFGGSVRAGGSGLVAASPRER